MDWSNIDITNTAEIKSNYEQAKAKYNEVKAKEDALKEEKIQAKLKSLSFEDKQLINECENPVEKTYGKGLKTLLFLAVCALAVGVWFLGVKNTSVKLWLYIIISVVVAIIVSNVLVFIFNGKSRNEAKRIAKIKETPNIKEYYDYRNTVLASESEELKEADLNYDLATQALFQNANIDSIIIFAPSSLTDDTLTLYKSLTVFIDDRKYTDALSSGVTKIKVNPGYHTIRFEAYEVLKKDNGLVGSFMQGYREGAYGSADTSLEFTCQIDTNSREPVGVVIDKKKGVLVLDSLTYDDYETYSETV